MVHSIGKDKSSVNGNKMTTSRENLLEAAILYIANHGLSDMSLRELASEIGTSHRMIIYHFGSRQGLVAAIVESMERQQRDALAQIAQNNTTTRDVIEAQWAHLSDPAMRPFVCLFFEVLSLALHERPGTESFVASMTTPWLDLGDKIVQQLGLQTRRDDVRLGVAVVRGLLIEVAATGDLAAPTASLNRFLDLLDAHAIQ